MLQQLKTAGGFHIEYEQHHLEYDLAIEPLLDRLDSHRGALFASSFEYPGRYTCWDIGFYNPPLFITCVGASIHFTALNKRGEALLAMVFPLFVVSDDVEVLHHSLDSCQMQVKAHQRVSELTMCTDVDRNDKSRICEAGSVLVIGRRQIEMYSRVIHTVDHVEGTLRDGFDAVDAFLTHMWVVTVTGAPKLWAMRFIEQHEKSPRKWYAGAVGWFNFNGNLNTGLVLRTIRIENGVAEIRVGATLLYDSDPQAEEQETRLKASAFVELLQQPDAIIVHAPAIVAHGEGMRVLLVDHQDSFVHTLANYLRQTGAVVTTVRSEHALSYLQQQNYDLVFLSPGPGNPNDFKVSQTIAAVLAKGTPLFGVCLGLQGIVEHFGGELAVLDYPMHGKASSIDVIHDTGLFKGLGASFTAGRYHSLYARLDKMPDVLEVTAKSQDGVVMAVSHRTLPIHAVQFHPETILSLSNQTGLRIISNLMGMLKANV